LWSIEQLINLLNSPSTAARRAGSRDHPQCSASGDAVDDG
jgi:hypothetical protein